MFPYRVRAALNNPGNGAVVTYVVQLVRRDETMVLNSPDRGLDVEGVAAS